MRKKINKDLGLRVLVFMEEKMFIAQCLEYDICTQAHDLETLKDRMDALISIELEYANETGIDIPPAPSYVQKHWNPKAPSYQDVAA